MKACSLGLAATVMLSLGAVTSPPAAATTIFNNFAGSPAKQTELVKIDGKLYALDISGLVHDGNPVEEFWTKEKDMTSAELRAQLRLVSAAVPEPANWAMMIVGFGVAGAAVRAGRRRNFLAK
jgi:hypothetical protein